MIFRKTLCVITFIFLNSHNALADNVSEAIENIEHALAHAKFESIERHAQELSAYELKSVYRELFDAADTQRFNEVKAWHEQTPDTPYSATALAMQYHTRGFLKRGANSSRLTSPEAFAAFREHIYLARTLTDAALDLDPDFFPALETSLRLSLVSPGHDSVFELTEKLLEQAPHREFLQLGIDSLSLRWGGSFAESIELCTELSDLVEGYDPAVCPIEVVFRNEMKGEAREHALKLLETRDEDFLDYARLMAYLREWRHLPNAAEESIRIHTEYVAKTKNMHRAGWYLSGLATVFKRPFYEMEAREAMRNRIRKLLKDDPENHSLAVFLIDDIIRYEGAKHGALPEAMVDELTTLWPNMLALGEYDYMVWDAGRTIASLRNGFADIDAQQSFVTNSIYYSNHHPSLIKNQMGRFYSLWEIATGETDVDPSLNTENLKAEILCPMVRVSRLYEAICQRDPSNTGCNVGGWDAIFPEHVRRITNNTKECSAEKDAPLQSLAFNPVTVSPNVFEQGVGQ